MKKFSCLLFALCVVLLLSACENNNVTQNLEKGGFCVECGGEILSTYKFCAFCGISINKQNDTTIDDNATHNSNYVEHVTIPEFVGLSKEEAETLAKSLGLKVAYITDTYSSEHEDNVIIRQSSEKDVIMTKGATITLSVNNDIYKYFNFKIIDGTVTVSNRLFAGAVPADDSALPYMKNDTYIIVSMNNKNLPSTLIIPETYNGKPITALQKGLLENCNINTLILPKTIEAIGSNLCGNNIKCPSLEKIIFTNTNPCYLGSLALTDQQLSGGCKIYVPDASVAQYKNSEIGEAKIGDIRGYPFKTYADLIYPISSLDDATKNLIS